MTLTLTIKLTSNLCTINTAFVLLEVIWVWSGLGLSVDSLRLQDCVYYVNKAYLISYLNRWQHTTLSSIQHNKTSDSNKINVRSTTVQQNDKDRVNEKQQKQMNKWCGWLVLVLLLVDQINRKPVLWRVVIPMKKYLLM